MFHYVTPKFPRVTTPVIQSMTGFAGNVTQLHQKNESIYIYINLKF